MLPLGNPAKNKLSLTMYQRSLALLCCRSKKSYFPSLIPSILVNSHQNIAAGTTQSFCLEIQKCMQEKKMTFLTFG